MTGAFWTIFKADIGLALKHGGCSWMAIGFFLVVVAMFPFGIGPEPMLLERISAGVVWVAALLSALLSLDVIFGTDHEDGEEDRRYRRQSADGGVGLSGNAVECGVDEK